MIIEHPVRGIFATFAIDFLMELQLYHLSLLVVGIADLAMAVGLLCSNYAYRHYPVYHRSCYLTALFFAVFGIGILLHWHFQWRLSYPLLATALSVSYFHICGVVITWSHTSLLNPRYLSRKVVVRDMTILAVGLTSYWTAANSTLFVLNMTLLIFLFHAVWLTVDFYTTYRRVSHRLIVMKQGSVEGFMRWMLRSCHLIIAFGIGSIVFTSLFPRDVWPYTVLLCVGGMVFVYIYYSISEYGTVIDSATNATEDAALYLRK